MMKYPRGWLQDTVVFAEILILFITPLSDKISFGKLKQPSITLSDISAVGLESVGLLTTSRGYATALPIKFQGFLDIRFSPNF